MSCAVRASQETIAAIAWKIGSVMYPWWSSGSAITVFSRICSAKTTPKANVSAEAYLPFMTSMSRFASNGK